MPKTKSPIQISIGEYMADIQKWLNESRTRQVQVVNTYGQKILSIGGIVYHTNRVEHKYEDHRWDPQMLSDLRDYFCEKDLNDESTAAVVEFIEAYADSQMYNLDDYSNREEE